MIRIDLQIQIVTYFQKDIYIVYAPELDLSGYDKTLSDAHKSFKIVLEEYFKYTISQGTLIEDLKKQGWTFKDLKLKPPTKQKLKSRLSNLPKTFNVLEQNYQIELA